MRTSVLSRSLAIVTGVAIASCVVTVPSSAGASSAITTQAVSPRIGVWDDYSDADLAHMAHEACTGMLFDAGQWLEPSIDDIAYVESGGNVEALLISAEIDTDGVVTEGFRHADTVCTFAAIGTRSDTGGKFGNTLDASYQLTVSSLVDPSKTESGRIYNTPTGFTKPVFTDVEYYANASVTSSGSHVTWKDGTVTQPGTPANAGQIQRAKKLYDVRVKAAKKAYNKAVKKASKVKNKKKRTAARKRAKKTYRAQVVGARNIYQQMIGPSPARTRPGTQTVLTPFSLTASIVDSSPQQ